MSVLKGLIGKKIYDISVSHGEEYLVFHTDAGEVWYQTWGDCCSQTWFSDILGIKFLLNEQILSVRNIAMPAWYNIDDGRCRQEEDSWYGHEIITSKGVATIIYRNSSNGYYGGDISEIVDRPNPETAIGMRILSDDWSA